MGNKVLARECKFIFHLPMIDEYRDDTHVIKETLHMEDGSLVSNLRILNNFERPFYVTKPIKQIYKQKKESELIDNLNMYKATDSMLGVAAATRLGREFIGKKTLYDVSKSPYLYGTDVSAATIIKNMYMTKYPDAISEYKLCVIDIEADVDTGEMVIVSVCTRENIYTAILSKIVKNKKTFQDDIKYLYKKHIPDTEISRAIKPVFELFDNEITMLKAVMAKAHTWKPDFMVVWNIEYEIPFFMKLCEANSVRPEDIFSDPDLPRNLKYFNYKQGQKSKKTASGVFKPMNPEEQWHVVHCPAHFYWIDAMSAHRYVRAGGKSVSGGYSLDNILNKELGEKFMKLKFTNDPNIEGKKGIDWHKYMLHNKPLEYIIYNNWDTMSILHLDNHTKDLCNVLPMLSGVSSFDIFNSGPKRIADAMYFFYKENGKILGTKGKSLSDEYIKKEDKIEDTILGLDNWINNEVKTKIIKKPITTHDGVLVYALPNMSRYGLSKTGELYDFKIKRYRPWWVSKPPILNKKNIKHGYKNTSVRDDNGNLKYISRHRMMLSIFKPTENMDKLFVNHINGIPGDDRLDNLEWTTPRDNLIHAINNGLMPNSVIGVDMLNTKTNEIKCFISAAEAARYLNWSYGKLKNRLNKNGKYFDNLIFKKSTDPEFKLNKPTVLMGVRREIVAVFPNGEIKCYPTIMHASSDTGVNTTSISVNSKLNNGKSVKGYKFYFKENFNTVPLHSNM